MAKNIPAQPPPWAKTSTLAGEGFFGYNQKKVIRLAPDCLVYLNGELSLPVCTKCGKSRDIRNDIVSVSVTASIDSTVSSASIVVKTPRHEEDIYFKDGQSIFSSMMEVRVYMKGRFAINGEYPYYPVFWGLVSSVSESGAAGDTSVTLECSGMLRWWQLMKTVIQPSVGFSELDPGITPSAMKTRWANKNPFQILYTLSQISFLNTMPPVGVNQQNTIKETTQQWRERNADLLRYWNKRFGELGSVLLMYGVDSLPISLDRQGVDSRAENDRRLGEQLSFYTIPHLKNITTEQEPIGPFAGVAQGNFTETEMMSNLEVANKVKEFIGYEFFQQMDGTFVFKPPFFNLDVRPNYPVSWIEDADLESYSFSEAESEVVTRMEVKGSWDGLVENQGAAQPTGYYQDYNLTKQYGYRVDTAEMGYLRDAESCRIYAMSELSKKSVMRHTGSASIVGRPEIQLGYPVYIPFRDSFMYVTGISHSFTFGSTFTTTLNLGARRAKVYDGEGKLRKNSAMVFKSSEPPTDARTDGVVTPTDQEKKFRTDNMGITRSGNEPGTWEEVGDHPVKEGNARELPVSDSEGYSLVGLFPYARNLMVDGGKVVPSPGATSAKWFTEWLVKATDDMQADPPALLAGAAEVLGNAAAMLKTWNQLAEEGDANRRAVYLADTQSARSVGNVGKTLVELGDSGNSGACTCGIESKSFEEYLKYVLMGVVAPPDAALTDKLVQESDTAAGVRKNQLLSALQEQQQKTEEFISSASNRLENSEGLTDSQRSELKQSIISAESQKNKMAKSIESKWSPDDMLTKPPSVGDLVGLRGV